MTELPTGWMEMRLDEVAAFSPRAPKPLDGFDPEITFLPMAAVQEVSGGTDLSQTISVSEGKRKNLTHMEDGDVIFAKITPCMENGKISVVEGLTGGRAYGSTEFHVLRPTGATGCRFLWYFLVRDDFRWEAERAMTGAVGQRRVPRKYLEACSIPTPPIEEQDEIVRILDTQLARLDTVLGAVQAVRDKAEQFRRSLLHAAFTGQLTQPDEERGDTSPDDWEEVTLGDVARWGSGGTPKSTNPAYYGGPIPWLQSGELNDETVYSTEKSITELGLAESSARLIEPGALLVAMYGATRGRVGVAGVEMASNQAVAFAQPDESVVSTEYMRLALMASRKALMAKGKGGAQANISQTVLKAWPLAVAPLAEQAEIVRILDTQLARLDKALEVADHVEAECGRLRRSLLQAAFSGVLTRKWREANG